MTKYRIVVRYSASGWWFAGVQRWRGWWGWVELHDTVAMRREMEDAVDWARTNFRLERGVEVSEVIVLG